MGGIARARRIGTGYVILAVGPMFLLIIPDALGVHGSPAWWVLVSMTGAWALFVGLTMVGATAIAIYRAARVRLATDRGEKSRYPRKQAGRQVRVRPRAQ